MTDILTVDARGLACPQPVLETKKVLEETSSRLLRVFVQGYTSRENVSRFARNRGCQVEVHEKGKDEFEITLTRADSEIPHNKQEDPLPCPVPERSRDGKTGLCRQQLHGQGRRRTGPETYAWIPPHVD